MSGMLRALPRRTPLQSSFASRRNFILPKHFDALRSVRWLSVHQRRCLLPQQPAWTLLHSSSPCPLRHRVAVMEANQKRSFSTHRPGTSSSAPPRKPQIWDKIGFFQYWSPKARPYIFMLVMLMGMYTAFKIFTSVRKRFHPTVREAVSEMESAEWFQALVQRHNDRVARGEAKKEWKGPLRPHFLVLGSVGRHSGTSDLSFTVNTPAGLARVRVWGAKDADGMSPDFDPNKVHYQINIGRSNQDEKNEGKLFSIQKVDDSEDDTATATGVTGAEATAGAVDGNSDGEGGTEGTIAALGVDAAENELVTDGGDGSWWSWLGFGSSGGSSSSSSDEATAEDTSTQDTTLSQNNAAAAATAAAAVVAGTATTPGTEAGKQEEEASSSSSSTSSTTTSSSEASAQEQVAVSSWQAQDITIDFLETQTRWTWDRRDGIWDERTFNPDNLRWYEKRSFTPSSTLLGFLGIIVLGIGMSIRNRRLRPTLHDAVRRKVKKSPTPLIQEGLGGSKFRPMPGRPKPTKVKMGHADHARLQLNAYGGQKGTLYVDAVKSPRLKPDGTPVTTLIRKKELYHWKVVNARFRPEVGPTRDVKKDLGDIL